MSTTTATSAAILFDPQNGRPVGAIINDELYRLAPDDGLEEDRYDQDWIVDAAAGLLLAFDRELRSAPIESCRRVLARLADDDYRLPPTLRDEVIGLLSRFYVARGVELHEQSEQHACGGHS